MRARLHIVVFLAVALVGARAARADTVASPNPANLGSVAVGGSTTKTLTLTNAGGFAIQINSIAPQTPPACTAGEFTVVSPTMFPSSLGPGQAVTVSMSFAPVARGNRTCGILVNNGAFSGFTVTGTGVAPVSTITPASQHLDVGQVHVAHLGPSSFTITNTTTDGLGLVVDSVGISGADAVDYAFGTLPIFPLTLPQGQSLTIPIHLFTSSTGVKNAQVDVTTSDPITPFQSVTVTGASVTSIIALAPAVAGGASFVAVTAGTSVGHDMTISNTGVLGTLNVTSGSLTGGAGWFTLAACGGALCTFGTPISIAAGGSSAPQTVTCSPPLGATGTQSATLTYTSDTDLGGSPSLTLSCSAVKPDVSIAPVPHTHDWGAVAVGSPSAWTSGLVITNAGGASLAYSIAKTGTNAGDFAITSGCTSGCTLGPGLMAVYGVTFTPAAAGGRSATLTINSDDQDAGDSSQAFTLTGTGGQATLTGAPAQNGTLAFGGVTVGGASSAQTITATNSGTQSLTITSATLAGGDFLLASGSTLAQTVAPGNAASWTIACKPLSRGAKTGTFTVVNSSTNTPIYAVNLTCSGQGGNLISSTATIAMGAVRVGSTQTKTFTLTNTGELPVNVSSATISPLAVGYSVSGVPASLAPSGTATVTVTFAPLAVADGGAATLALASDWNDPTVALTGTATTAVIGLAPTSYNFGVLTAGTSATHDITVSNAGAGANLTVTGATLGGASWMSFAGGGCSGASCTFSPALSIAPAATSPLTIRCAPPAGTTGTQVAILTVASDSNAGGGSTATLTCTAVKPDVVITPSALSHDFGDVRVATASTWSNLLVTNAGGATLTFAIARGGTNAGDFVMSGPGCPAACGGSLAAGAVATYAITFTPAAQGARSASLTITSNDQDATDATQSFGVTGVGVQPTLAGTPAPNGALAFGGVTVGVQSAAQTVTVSDTGNQDLSIASATLTGGDFVLVGGSAAAQIVVQGGTASWTIACKPGARGAKNGTFVVANDSTNQASYTIGLTCSGQAGNLTATPALLGFGGVPVGTAPQKTFVLQNTGELLATISSAAISPPTVGYHASGVPATLAPGATATVTVTFAPQSGSDGGPATLTIGSDWNAPTVSLDGDGQTVGLDVSPTQLDYGAVRWDQTKAQVFHLANTSQSPVTVSSIALTAAGNFTIINPPTVPFTLAVGASKDVTVDADPNDTMLGRFTSTLEITDNVPATPIIDVALSVESVSPALTIDPTPADFGGVDIDQATAKTLTITLHDTGDGPMDVVGAPPLTGVFTSAGVPAPVTVAPGSSTTVAVSYLPTVETTAATGDTAALVVSIDGLISSGNPQPTMVSVQLSGHGTDRHLVLTGSPIVFPDTYRNPSDADAPVAAVTAQNTGEAPLEVSAVMLSGDPDFTLLDTQPVTVPGGESTQFRVRFVPTTDTGAYTGTLAIMHDDDGFATPRMATVPVSGRAVSRTISVTPGNTIDVGTTYVGVPVRLSDHGSPIEITNGDAARTIVVRLVMAGDAAGLTIVDATAQTVGPGQHATFDVELDPDTEGDFAGTAQILLDDDPVPDGTITLTGRGIPGRGSYYACNAGDPAGLLPIGIALALLLVRRRAPTRRRSR